MDTFSRNFIDEPSFLQPKIGILNSNDFLGFISISFGKKSLVDKKEIGPPASLSDGVNLFVLDKKLHTNGID